MVKMGCMEEHLVTSGEIYREATNEITKFASNVLSLMIMDFRVGENGQ